MTKNFDIAKKNYERGLWTKEMIANLTEKGKITETEYKEIVGEDYTEA